MPNGNASTPATPSTATPAPAPADDPVADILLGWAVATGGAWAAMRLLPEAAGDLLAPLPWIVVALAIPLARGRSLAAEGLAWRRPLRSLAWFAGTSVIVLPLFALGFCALRSWQEGRPLALAAPSLRTVIPAFIWNLYSAGLPEECFFRGLVQPRLAAMPRKPAWMRALPDRRVLFVRLTPASIVAAAPFAVTHVVFLSNPLSARAAGRLLTFFPGLLFGALREETGDVVAPALFHALCNAWLAGLSRAMGA